MDLDEIRPELFAGSPDLLVALAADLQLRGGFERGRRALALARRADIDPAQQPELAVQLASVNVHVLRPSPVSCEEALAQRQWARSLDIGGGAVDDVAPRPRRRRAPTATPISVNSTRPANWSTRSPPLRLSPPPVTDVLCPGLNSQIAFAEGALTQADDLRRWRRWSRAAGSALTTTTSPSRPYAPRPSLALERRHLDAAARLVEQILELVSGARPTFEYFAQLDRARIWAAAGNLEGALSSLPAARTALEMRPLSALRPGRRAGSSPPARTWRSQRRPEDGRTAAR